MFKSAPGVDFKREKFFMNHVITKAGCVFLKQSGDSVGAPSTVMDPLTTKIGQTGNIVKRKAGLGQNPFDF